MPFVDIDPSDCITETKKIQTFQDSSFTEQNVLLLCHLPSRRKGDVLELVKAS